MIRDLGAEPAAAAPAYAARPGRHGPRRRSAAAAQDVERAAAESYAAPVAGTAAGRAGGGRSRR